MSWSSVIDWAQTGHSKETSLSYEQKTESRTRTVTKDLDWYINGILQSSKYRTTFKETYDQLMHRQVKTTTETTTFETHGLDHDAAEAMVADLITAGKIEGEYTRTVVRSSRENEAGSYRLDKTIETVTIEKGSWIDYND